MTAVPTRVLVTCPETGSKVATMLRLRPEAFETLRGEYAFRCNECGQVHGWRREDAWLEPPRSR